MSHGYVSCLAVGAKGYSDKKVRTLLNVVREHMPIGSDGWELVAEIYNKKERVCHV